MQHFNPIQSKWVVAAPMRRVRLLQQSIPFGVAVLYTLVQKQFNICSLKSKEIIIFAHNFISEQNTNQATCCLDFQSSIFSLSLGLDTLFQLQSILTLIV